MGIQSSASMEEYLLSKNNYGSSIQKSFRKMFSDTEFSDVTLVCEEEVSLRAHKVVLAGSSPFFARILGRNPHPSPLVYLKGLQASDLRAALQFIYLGEARVARDQVPSFLAAAKDLEVEGLTQEEVDPGVQDRIGTNKERSKTKKAIRVENSKVDEVIAKVEAEDSKRDELISKYEKDDAEDMSLIDMDADAARILEKEENIALKIAAETNEIDTVEEYEMVEESEYTEEPTVEEDVSMEQTTEDFSETEETSNIKMEQTEVVPSATLAEELEGTNEIAKKEGEAINTACDKCEFTSNAKGQKGFIMRRHYQRVHGVEPSELPKTASPTVSAPKVNAVNRGIAVDPTKQIFNCEKCDFTTNHKTSLKRHDSVHTGEKAWTCNFCPKATTQKYDLKMHLEKNHPGQEMQL